MFVLMSDMQNKDIINTKDGSKLGRIVDINVSSDGKINYFITSEAKMLRRMNSEEHKIAFEQIKTIGNDVILVDLN